MVHPSRAAPIEATLIPGDGIGPEIVAAVRTVLDALGSPFRWDERAAGMAAVEKFADPLPRETLLESIRRTKLALEGAADEPRAAAAVGGGFRSVNVRLREEFELYANVRPVRTLVQGQRYDNIDLVLIRENLEGLYVGFEHYVPIGDDPHAVAIGSGINTRAGARRIMRYAFDYAVRHGRKKVTVVHKANVLKALTGLFLETGMEMAKEYSGRIQVDQRIVDACAMQLVINPWQFDVIVTTNLFGDILSDLLAGLVGGLGPGPSAPISASAPRFSRPCMAPHRTSRVRGSPIRCRCCLPQRSCSSMSDTPNQRIDSARRCAPPSLRTTSRPPISAVAPPPASSPPRWCDGFKSAPERPLPSQTQDPLRRTAVAIPACDCSQASRNPPPASVRSTARADRPLRSLEFHSSASAA